MSLINAVWMTLLGLGSAAYYFASAREGRDDWLRREVAWLAAASLVAGGAYFWRAAAPQSGLAWLLCWIAQLGMCVVCAKIAAMLYRPRR